jgi:hypothetical protein
LCKKQFANVAVPTVGTTVTPSSNGNTPFAFAVIVAPIPRSPGTPPGTYVYAGNDTVVVAATVKSGTFP